MSVLKHCEECGKEFMSNLGKHKFCSKLCANIKKGKNVANANQNGGKWLTCSSCHKEKPFSSFSYKIRGDITSGKKNECKRCGANSRETKRRDRTWKDDARQILLDNSKQRAKKSNLEHNLQKEDICIPDTCPVFGIPLKREDKKTWLNAPSIDRIENNKGYTKDNIIIVSRRANILKKDATVEELEQLADFYKRLKKEREGKDLNIFVIDADPRIAALHLHNRHITKMTLESAQLLSTVQRHCGNEDTRIYRKTHISHPCTVWVRTSKQNYIWLVQHFEALFKEFTYRYNKIHKSSKLFDLLKYPPDQLPNIGLTPFVKAMPDKYKVLDSIQSYRNYYLGEKIQGNYWTKRTSFDLDNWLSSQLSENQFKRGKVCQ